MKTRYFYLMAALALVAGCAKESLESGSELSGEKFYLTVGLPSDSKTHMGESEAGSRPVYWSNGDQIAVNGVASDELSGLADGVTSTQFSFSAVLNPPYNVLYPASIYEDATQVTLPAVQTYKAGGFAEGMNPMAGYTDGSNIQLSHLCAVVKISIKRAATSADEDNIVAVRFKGRNNEQVSGDFTIDYETPALAAATGSGADLEVRVVKNQATSTTTAIDYYLVVPARSYSNGFDVIVQDVNGHIMTKSKTSFKDPNNELKAGHLYNMPEFEFVPTETELGVAISSAQDLIDFATAYNAKEYAQLGTSLVATLVDDISFTAEESEAFNATKGIGLKISYYGDTEDYYFDGTFDGGNHTISGLDATVPLFKATSSSATIKDFTLDNTCSFEFTHSKVAELDAAAVVGYHRGTISNINVAAGVSLAEVDGVNKVTALGGLVGRGVVGIVDNCTYSGAISVPAGFQSSAQKIFVGGLVGEISNADGKVKDSSFAGTIDNQGQMIASSETDDFKANPQLMIGGIIGLNTGTIDNCTVANHATGITVILNDGSDHPYTGTVVTHSTNAYHYAIAGVAGRNEGTVKDCINNATVLNLFSAARGDGGNMNGRYLEVGGIVGFNASSKTVSGCTNNGAIITRANPKIQYIGGVVAWNYGIVSSCENTSTGAIGMGTSHTSPYGARMSYVGGVIGHNSSSATVSNIQNAANLSISRVETTTGVIHRIGGVVGLSDAVIDGASNGGTIINSGTITQQNGVGMCATPTADNDYGYFLGGVVGYATKAVKNVSNSGNVTYTCNATGVGAQYVHLGGVIGKVLASSTIDVEKCTNTANVTFIASAKYSDNNATRYYYNYLGGIVGYAKNAAIKGESSNKCTNSGVIKGGDGSANNNQGTQSFTIGGIVGYLTGASSVEYCELAGTGQAYNDHWSNRGVGSYDCPMDGGIVGLVIGTEEAPITITNCSVSSTRKAKETDPDGLQAVYARRGAVGGIVGMAQYATISNCSVPVPFTGSGYFYGGIVAAAQNSEITSCTYSGTTIQSSQLQIGGGIIGQLDAGTTIDGCSSYATTVNKNGTAVTTTGGIAGKSVSGSTISNSHYTASIAKICGDSNFTDGSGNVADL